MQVIDWVKALNSYKNLFPLATLHNNDRQTDEVRKQTFQSFNWPLLGKNENKKRPVKVRLAQCGILKRAQNILLTLRVHLDSLAEKQYERKIIAFKMTVAEKV